MVSFGFECDSSSESNDDDKEQDYSIDDNGFDDAGNIHDQSDDESPVEQSDSEDSSDPSSSSSDYGDFCARPAILPNSLSNLRKRQANDN